MVQKNQPDYLSILRTTECKPLRLGCLRLAVTTAILGLIFLDGNKYLSCTLGQFLSCPDGTKRQSGKPML